MSNTEPFDGNTLRKIAGQIAKGTHQNEVWKDYECVSLQIRIGKTSGAWTFKTRDNQIKIADFNVFGKDDIPALRALVLEAKKLEKEGRSLEPMFKEFVARRSVADAKAQADVHDGLGLRWEAARDLFLAWAQQNRSHDTHRTYRSALGAAKKSKLLSCFEPISGKPVSTITTADLARVRNRINERGKDREHTDAKGRCIRQADLTVSVLKSAWMYFVNEPDKFGEDISSRVTDDLKKVRDRETRPESSSGEAERTLNQLEIGMILDQLGESRNEMARHVLALQLLTGQRRLDVVSAIRHSFVDKEGFGLVWRLEDKVHAWRVLPLPSMAQDVVKNAIKLFAAYNSRYLFPKNRKQKKSDMSEGHMSERTVSKALELMSEEGGPFYESPLSPSTHYLRKAFTTYMAPRMHKYVVEGRTLTRDDIDMITHRDEGRETTATLVYDKSEYLEVKLAILTEWENYVIEGLNMWLAEKAQRSMKMAA